MRLLLDMNVSPRWIAPLRAAGHEAVAWRTVGDRRADDVDIMRYAAEHGYVVMTHDLDFSDILAATGGTAPSVIQLRGANALPELLWPALREALVAEGDALQRGALMTIDARRARIRVLPLIRRS